MRRRPDNLVLPSGIDKQDCGEAGGSQLLVAGLLVGFGTRMGSGCTSGHGIFGLSNLELPSLVSTLSFMAGGIVTTQILYRVILR
jgi:hypothetical protein